MASTLTVFFLTLGGQRMSLIFIYFLPARALEPLHNRLRCENHAPSR